MSENPQVQIEDDEIDLMTLIKILWDRRLIIGVTFVLFTVIAGLLPIVLTPQFDSVSKWLPNQKSGGGAGQLSSLAALAGVNMGGASTEDYEAHYDEILKSPLLLDSLIFRKWCLSSGDSLTLLEILKLDFSGINLEKSYVTKQMLIHNSLYGYLSQTIQFERTATAFSLTIQTIDPVLSYEINNYLLYLLKAYSESEKSSKAKKERLFVEERYKEFKNDLKSAEAKLKKFRENNMNINSPNLMLSQQRLIREVEIYNQLVIEFRKQLELAKIEEIKKIPEFNVVQEPTVPISKSKPKKKLILIAGGVLGLIIGCLFAFILGWWSEHKEIILYRLNTKKSK
ncbi:MAG: Wzz/FepE/Etk N-terminal domain-containing protein [Fibrobacterales bacterium]